ncbi:MAG: glycerol-3-phosphate dehydrogenase C-terminal domain-containing protein [Pseudomonadota bacterium]
MGTDYDIFVLGDGLDAAAIARDAAGRGARVGLASPGDPGAVAPMIDGRLLAGGLGVTGRAALRDLKVQRAETRTLLSIAAPFLAQSRVVTPLRRHRLKTRVRRGAAQVVDWLAGPPFGSPRRHRLVAEGTRAGLRGRFKQAIEAEGHLFDAGRLAALMLMDAAARGADLFPRTEASAVADDATWRIRLAGPTPREVTTRALVRIEPGTEREVVVVARSRFPHPAILRLTEVGRAPVYIAPWGPGTCVIGPFHLGGTGPVTGSEAAEAVAAVSGCLAEPIFADQVPGVWATSFGGADTLDGTDLRVAPSRPSEVRARAEGAIDRLASGLGLRPAWTATVPLPGAQPTEGPAGAEGLHARYPFLDAVWARRLWHSYGHRAVDLLGDATRAADLGRAFGATLTEREVGWLIETEFAETAEDILHHRTRLGASLSAAETQALDAWMRDAQGRAA